MGALNSAPMAPALTAAAGADWARQRIRARLGRSSPTVTVGGVAFPQPSARNRHAPALYRERVLAGIWARLPDDLARAPGAGEPLRRFAPKLISSVDPSSLTPPLVLTTFHLGPMTAFIPFLVRLPGPTSTPVAAAVDAPRARALYQDKLLSQPVQDDRQRIQAFTHAVRTLRSGGFALVVADAFGTARVPATVLGRDVDLAGGAFALARLTGAPLLPLVPRWERGTVRMLAGDRIPAGDPSMMAAALGGWLEDYLREHPRELTAQIAEALDIPVAPRRRWSATASRR